VVAGRDVIIATIIITSLAVASTLQNLDGEHQTYTYGETQRCLEKERTCQRIIQASKS